MALTPQQQADLDRSLANMSPALQNFVKNLSNGSKTFTEIQDSLDAYKKSLTNQTNAYNESGRVIGAHTKRQEKNIKKADDTAEAFAKLAAATRKAQEDVASSGRVTQDTMDAYNTALESIRTTTGAVDQELEDLGRSFASGSATIQSNLNRLGGTINDQANQSLVNAQRMQRSNLPVIVDNIATAGRKYVAEMTSIGGFLRSLAVVVDATSDRLEEIRTAVGHSSQAFTVLPGFVNSMTALADATGMTTKDMQSADIANRQVINSLALQEDATIDLTDRSAVLNKSLGFLGSEFMNTAGQTIPSLSKEFANLTGSLAEGNKVLLQIMNNSRAAGIQTSGLAFQQAADDMAKEMKVMSVITGKSAAEIQSYINDYMSDPSIKNEMLKLDKKDRLEKMKTIYAEMTHQAALGKLNESTIAASKALAELKGQSAVSRYKAGAKAQMMMGALGVGGGAEFARLVAKPTIAQTDPEKKFIMEKSKEIAEAVKKMEAGGFATGENVANVTMAAQDPAVLKLIETNSNMADEGRAIGETQEKMIREQINEQGITNKQLSTIDGTILNSALQFEQHIAPLLSDSNVSIVAALVKVGASIVAAILGTSALSGIGGRITSTMARTGGGLGAAASGLAWPVAGLAVGGALIGQGMSSQEKRRTAIARGETPEEQSWWNTPVEALGGRAKEYQVSTKTNKTEAIKDSTIKTQNNIEKSADHNEEALKVQTQIRDILTEQNKNTQAVKNSIDAQTTAQKNNTETVVDGQKDAMRKMDMKNTLTGSDGIVSP
jgi:hypothetical protein